MLRKRIPSSRLSRVGSFAGAGAGAGTAGIATAETRRARKDRVAFLT
jgi:hypothetical protein